MRPKTMMSKTGMFMAQFSRDKVAAKKHCRKCPGHHVYAHPAGDYLVLIPWDAAQLIEAGHDLKKV